MSVKNATIGPQRPITIVGYSERVRTTPLSRINAAKVGLLVAAHYNLVWSSAIHSAADFALGLIGFGLLMFWQWPPWIVVVLSDAAGEILSWF